METFTGLAGLFSFLLFCGVAWVCFCVIDMRDKLARLIKEQKTSNERLLEQLVHIRIDTANVAAHASEVTDWLAQNKPKIE